MPEGDPLPDNAVVVRCGRPPFPGRPLHTACDDHPSGYYGFSVQAAAGLTVEQLALECRNNVVGYMIAGEIRRLGYEVRETSGPGRHATVVVPKPWDPTLAERLAALFLTAKNPRARGRP
jgi:hypothetical protein